MQKKQKRILIFSILLGVLLIVGISFAYSSSNYWTMSPSRFYVANAAVFGFAMDPSGDAFQGSINNRYSVRPVINLASTVEIESGIGTQNDPYVVKVV